MNHLEEKVLDALRKVYDPDLKQDLVSLGMIEGLVVQGTSISFTIVLTTPACPLQEAIKQACIEAIRNSLGGDFHLCIHMGAKVTSSRSHEELLPGVKNIIAIASGKGGVGKSTVATHLALTLSQQGASVGLLDGDIFGPSIPTMWGCEKEKIKVIEYDEKKQMLPIDRYGIKLLSIGFLAPSQEAIVWRGPMASAAFKQLIQDTDWGPLDYLFIDLPPGTSDIHLTLVQTIKLTGVVVVTTPQRVSLMDAMKAIAMFNKERFRVPILGLIENMSYFEIKNTHYYIFGEDGGRQLAEKEQISFLGQVPLFTQICQIGDRGIMADTYFEPFKEITQKLTQKIAIRNAYQNLE